MRDVNYDKFAQTTHQLERQICARIVLIMAGRVLITLHFFA